MFAKSLWNSTSDYIWNKQWAYSTHALISRALLKNCPGSILASVYVQLRIRNYRHKSKGIYACFLILRYLKTLSYPGSLKGHSTKSFLLFLSFNYSYYNWKINFLKLSTSAKPNCQKLRGQKKMQKFIIVIIGNKRDKLEPHIKTTVY